MAKLVKQLYYTSTGEAKLNCYKATLPRAVVEQAGITADDEVIVYADGDKIVIRKA